MLELLFYNSAVYICYVCGDAAFAVVNNAADHDDNDDDNYSW